MRGLIWLVLSVVFAVALALAWLVSTPSGARWLASQAEGVWPALAVESVSGSVVGGLTLEGVHWSDARGEVRLGAVTLDWQPGCLRRWTVCVERLVVDEVSVTPPPDGDPAPPAAMPDTPAGDPSLPRVALPLDVEIDQLLIRDAVLQRRDTPIEVHRVDLAATLKDSALTVSQLDITAPAGEASVEGEITLAGDWPLTLALRLQPATHLTEGQALTAEARLAGRVQALTVEGTLSGLEPGPVDLDATLSLFEQPRRAEVRATAAGGELQADARVGEALDVDIDLHAPDLAAFWPGLAGSVDGQVTVSGALQSPRISADLSAEGVSYAGSALAAGRLVGDWDPATGGDLTLQATGLEYDGERLGNLDATLAGERAEHRLALRLDEGPVAAALTLEGGLSDTAGDWQGQVLEAEATLPDGRWRMTEQPDLALDIAARTLELGEHCWARAAYTVCADPLTASPREAELRLVSNRVDLAVLERWLPEDTGLPGTVSGTADLNWSAGSPPRARLTLVTADSRVELPQPNGADPLALSYDRIVLDADLRPDAAVLRMGIAADDLGRGGFSVAFDPSAAAGDPGATPLEGTVWTDDLPLAPLAGLLPQLRGVEGAVGASGQLGGTLAAPDFQGRVMLEEGGLRPSAISTAVEGINLEAAIDGRRARIRGGFEAGEGEGTLEGELDWSDGPVNGSLDLVGEGLEIERGPSVSLRVDPTLNLTLAPDSIRLSGDIQVPWARLRLIGSSSSATRVSGDAVRVDAEGEPETAADVGESGQRVLESDLRVVLGDDVRFEGFGASGGLTGSLRLRQLGGDAVEGDGVIELVDARYQAYGQDLRVRRGRIIFSGPMGDPRLDIEAVRDSEQVLAGLRIDGSARSPGVTLFSTPPMEQVDILAYLLTGRPPGEDSASETALLGQAALSLGVLGGDRVGQALAEELGIEDFQLEASGEGEDAQVSVSGYLAPNLLVRYGVGVFEPDNTLSLRYYLSSQFYLEAISGTESALDIFYTFDYD